MGRVDKRNKTQGGSKSQLTLPFPLLLPSWNLLLTTSLFFLVSFVAEASFASSGGAGAGSGHRCVDSVLVGPATTTAATNLYRRCNISGNLIINFTHTAFGRSTGRDTTITESLVTDSLVTITGFSQSVAATTGSSGGMACPIVISVEGNRFERATIRLSGHFPRHSLLTFQRNTFYTVTSFTGVSFLFPTIPYSLGLIALDLHLTESVLSVSKNDAFLVSTAGAFALFMRVEAALTLSDGAVFAVTENNATCLGTDSTTDNYFFHFRNLGIDNFILRNNSKQVISNNTFFSGPANTAVNPTYRYVRVISFLSSAVNVTDGSVLAFNGNRVTATHFADSAILVGNVDSGGLYSSEVFLSDRAVFTCTENHVVFVAPPGTSATANYAALLALKTLSMKQTDGSGSAVALVKGNTFTLSAATIPAAVVTAVDFQTIAAATAATSTVSAIVLSIQENQFEINGVNCAAFVKMTTVAVSSGGGPAGAVKSILADNTCVNTLAPTTPLLVRGTTIPAALLDFCPNNIINGVTLATIGDYTTATAVLPTSSTGTVYATAAACPANGGVPSTTAAMVSLLVPSTLLATAAAAARQAVPHECRTWTVSIGPPTLSVTRPGRHGGRGSASPSHSNTAPTHDATPTRNNSPATTTRTGSINISTASETQPPASQTKTAFVSGSYNIDNSSSSSHSSSIVASASIEEHNTKTQSTSKSEEKENESASQTVALRATATPTQQPPVLSTTSIATTATTTTTSAAAMDNAVTAASSTTFTATGAATTDVTTTTTMSTAPTTTTDNTTSGSSSNSTTPVCNDNTTNHTNSGAASAPTARERPAATVVVFATTAAAAAAGGGGSGGSTRTMVYSAQSDAVVFTFATTTLNTHAAPFTPTTTTTMTTTSGSSSSGNTNTTLLPFLTCVVSSAHTITCRGVQAMVAARSASSLSSSSASTSATSSSTLGSLLFQPTVLVMGYQAVVATTDPTSGGGVSCAASTPTAAATAVTALMLFHVVGEDDGSTTTTLQIVLRAAAVAAEGAATVLLLVDPTTLEHHIPALLLLSPCADDTSRRTASAARWMLAPGAGEGGARTGAAGENGGGSRSRASASSAVWVQLGIAVAVVGAHLLLVAQIATRASVRGQWSWWWLLVLCLPTASIAMPGLAWAAGWLLSLHHSSDASTATTTAALVVATLGLVLTGVATGAADVLSRSRSHSSSYTRLHTIATTTARTMSGDRQQQHQHHQHHQGLLKKEGDRDRSFGEFHPFRTYSSRPLHLEFIPSGGSEGGGLVSNKIVRLLRPSGRWLQQTMTMNHYDEEEQQMEHQGVGTTITTTTTTASSRTPAAAATTTTSPALTASRTPPPAALTLLPLTRLLMQVPTWTVSAGRGRWAHLRRLASVLLVVALCATTAGPPMMTTAAVVTTTTTNAVMDSTPPSSNVLLATVPGSCAPRQWVAAGLLLLYAAASMAGHITNVAALRSPATVVCATANLLGCALIAAGQANTNNNISDNNNSNAMSVPHHALIAGGAVLSSVASWLRLVHTIGIIVHDLCCGMVHDVPNSRPLDVVTDDEIP